MKAFAGWHKNIDDYKSAASGGVATAFAQKIILDGGAVKVARNEDGIPVLLVYYLKNYDNCNIKCI